MGIFTRVRDIINSNLNAMLSKAEDPAKLIRLMIQEMEDTLVEVKSSCAGAIATTKKIERDRIEVGSRLAEWTQRAELAVEKGREDLAREALMEKRRFRDRHGALESELSESKALVKQYQVDIAKLEDKIARAREKQRVLVQRAIHAEKKKKAENGIRKVESSDAVVRLEHFEHRIDRMEAEADLVNAGRRKPDLEDAFSRLGRDEEIEKELQELKASKGAKRAGSEV